MSPECNHGEEQQSAIISDVIKRTNYCHQSKQKQPCSGDAAERPRFSPTTGLIHTPHNIHPPPVSIHSNSASISPSNDVVNNTTDQLSLSLSQNSRPEVNNTLLNSKDSMERNSRQHIRHKKSPFFVTTNYNPPPLPPNRRNLHHLHRESVCCLSAMCKNISLGFYDYRK